MPFITHRIEILPFPVPTGVTVKQKPGSRQDGLKPVPEIPLSEIDQDTLNELCNDFRAAVFAAAGRRRPEVVTDDGR